MTTYVLVRANKVVKTIEGLRDLTTAESANSGRRYEVTGSFPIYIGGTVTLVNSKVTAISEPNAPSSTDKRREQVKEWLRAGDQQPVANWGLKDSAANLRAKNYWWWLEMIGAFSSVNSNLSNATLWNYFESEMAWGYADWYNKHRVSDWDGLRTTNTFYSTRTNGRWQTRNNFTNDRGLWTGLTNYIY